MLSSHFMKMVQRGWQRRLQCVISVSQVKRPPMYKAAARPLQVVPPPLQATANTNPSRKWCRSRFIHYPFFGFVFPGPSGVHAGMRAVHPGGDEGVRPRTARDGSQVRHAGCRGGGTALRAVDRRPPRHLGRHLGDDQLSPQRG